jgi:hypothetical protein
LQRESASSRESEGQSLHWPGPFFFRTNPYPPTTQHSSRQWCLRRGHPHREAEPRSQAAPPGPAGRRLSAGGCGPKRYRPRRGIWSGWRWDPLRTDPHESSEQVPAAVQETRFVRRPAETRVAEDPRRAVAPREDRMVAARGLGRPDVAVFNGVLALDEVQGHADEAISSSTR